MHPEVTALIEKTEQAPLNPMFAASLLTDEERKMISFVLGNIPTEALIAEVGARGFELASKGLADHIKTKPPLANYAPSRGVTPPPSPHNEVFLGIQGESRRMAIQDAELVLGALKLVNSILAGTKLENLPYGWDAIFGVLYDWPLARVPVGLHNKLDAAIEKLGGVNDAGLRKILDKLGRPIFCTGHAKAHRADMPKPVVFHKK